MLAAISESPIVRSVEGGIVNGVPLGSLKATHQPRQRLKIIHNRRYTRLRCTEAFGVFRVSLF
jgi:hypothetical protein